jgi:hypothetical protein
MGAPAFPIAANIAKHPRSGNVPARQSHLASGRGVLLQGSPGVDTALSTRGQKPISLIQRDNPIRVNPIETLV